MCRWWRRRRRRRPGAENGFVTPGQSGSGSQGGSAPGGSGGAPGGSGGHQGGQGGRTGTSAYRSDYFSNGQQSSSNSGNGSATMNVTYNNDYWTPGGGGGGGAGSWSATYPWDQLGNPANASVVVGAGGNSPGGGVSKGGNGYVK